MASQAAINGIVQYGLRWKLTISITIPQNIPALFAACKTSKDTVLLGHQITENLLKSLDRIKRSRLEAISPDTYTWLEDFKEDMRELFILDDPTAEQDFDLNAEGLEEELLSQLDELYNWADFNRILINRHG